MRSLNKYFYTFKISISNNLVYAWNLLARTIFFVFIVFVMLLLWKNIYGQKGEIIAGFSLNQMIWYLTIAEMISLSRSNIFSEVSEEVKKGNIAYTINKPYSYIFYCFSNSMGEIAVRLLTNVITALVIGIIYVGPLAGFKVIHLPMVIITMLLGICINFFIYMLLALSAFWLEENTALTWIYSKLVFTLGGMLIPLELFPDWLEKISRHLPFAYVTYAPAKLAVAYSSSGFINTLLYQLSYLGFFIAVSLLVFRRGVKALNVNGG